MRRTLAIALSLAAVLFLAPLAVAPTHDYRENGTTSTAAILAGTTFLSDPADLHRIAAFDVQPLDDDDEDDEDDDEDDDDDVEESEDDEDEDDDDDDVEVCHVPPGNPAAAHSIVIGAAAVPAHMGYHDDTLESCPGDDDDDGDDEDDDDEDGDGDQGDGDGETVSPSIALTLSADSIEDGQSVLASWTVADFALDGAAIGSTQNVQGRGHVHVLVDGDLVEMTASGSLELGDLGVGTHTVRVELRNNDHSALGPAVYDEATVTVTANGPTAATVGADPTWLFWILAIVIAMIAAAAAVLYRRRRHKPEQ